MSRLRASAHLPLAFPNVTAALDALAHLERRA
jgi:hypothetical protein